jgi:hypothetical protein
MHEQTVGRDLLAAQCPAALDEAPTDVYCWRLEQLLEVGYSRVVADILATDTEVDLHTACDLLANGCEERLAQMILR